MPSSMIFTGLVALWLIVLVPAVARHRQEVVRPSVAALSGRVLSRPLRRRSAEVETMQAEPELESVAGGTDAVEVLAAREPEDDRVWERPPPRFRPGRGGFDAEAAQLTARARYAFRQRVVLGLLVAAVVTAGAAVMWPMVWWAHGAFDVLLVGYLGYLRRQVRLEEAIRERRAARMAGTRRTTAANEPELDEWVARGRAVTTESPEYEADDDIDDEADLADEDEPEAERVVGTGEPVGLLRPLPAEVEEEAALPRLQPTAPPPLPAGTALVEADDEDLAVAEIELRHRRAVGE